MSEQQPPAHRGAHVPTPVAHPKDMASWKPGSEAELAKDVVSKGDFGVHVEKATRAERDYVNRNTKVSDPGAAQPWSRESIDGARTSGAGAHDGGVGSGSGGDIDTDIIGVGTGGSGLSQSGPSDRRRADDTDGSSAQFASGRPAAGAPNPTGDRFAGSTFTGDPEVETSPAGSDNATNPEIRDDDSFRGEISSGEARGEDNDIKSPESA
jgi:hypothetical protein